MRMSKPLPPERSETEGLDLPRLVFRFDKIHYGRLRQLIDALNRIGPDRSAIVRLSGRRVTVSPIVI